MQQYAEWNSIQPTNYLSMYIAQSDVELKFCAPPYHCSYWHVYTGSSASLLDADITRTFFSSSTQKFEAKIAIIQVSRQLFAPTYRTQVSLCIDSSLTLHHISQTWNKVPEYSHEVSDGTNTFQVRNVHWIHSRCSVCNVSAITGLKSNVCKDRLDSLPVI